VTVSGNRRKDDWVAKPRAYALAWGLPTAALVLAAFAPAEVRTLVWAGALVWMGLACLANARRCGRTHCRFTGPFFLVMAGATLLHGFGIVAPGPHGSPCLGGTLVVGGLGVFWLLPELIWGKYAGGRHRGLRDS
jgi:hypothetical protein